MALPLAQQLAVRVRRAAAAAASMVWASSARWSSAFFALSAPSALETASEEVSGAAVDGAIAAADGAIAGAAPTAVGVDAAATEAVAGVLQKPVSAGAPAR